MKRVDYRVLLTILDEETVKKIKRFLKGQSLYFPAREIEKEEILEAYNNLISKGFKNKVAIEKLANSYNKSISQVYRIIKYANKD